jgi:hypothetical protein
MWRRVALVRTDVSEERRFLQQATRHKIPEDGILQDSSRVKDYENIFIYNHWINAIWATFEIEGRKFRKHNMFPSSGEGTEIYIVFCYL